MKSLRKLVPAFSLLLVSAVILSSASFAWFTMSRQVTAQGMNVTVTAPNNLLIDAAGEGARTWDALEEIDSAAKTHAKLVPASTVNGSAFFALADNSGAKHDSGELYATASNVISRNDDASEDQEGTYYDFKYLIKTEGAEDVDVAVSSITVKSENGKTINPVRVAILKGDDVCKVVKGATGAALVVGGDTKAYALYRPVTTATNFTEVQAINAATAAGTAPSRAVAPYQTIDIKNTVFTVESASTEGVAITVRVWFEGEDENCTQALAASSKFSITVVFDAVPNA